MALDQETLMVIHRLVPPEIWRYREAFFYEGMRLDIGRCFADYGPPDFFRSATETFAGRAKLTDQGGIIDYTAGLPFPPGHISPEDPKAGLAWAWNFEGSRPSKVCWGSIR